MAFNLAPYAAEVALEQRPSHLRLVGKPPVRVPSSSKSSRRYPLPEAPTRTILYIGGDPECRIVLSRIVGRLDRIHLVVAATGREGRFLASSLVPRLILLDSELPDCDTHDLMVHFGRAALRATVPVAVLSGREHDRLSFIRAGAVSWMTKPLNIAEVERSITTLLDLFSQR